MRVALRGIAAAPGVAFGKALLVETIDPSPQPDRVGGNPEEQERRLRSALDAAVRQLTELAQRVRAEMGTDEAGIFEAQAAFAADPELLSRALEAIQGGATAEDAVSDAFTGFRDLLAGSSNEFLAARVADLDDVHGRVLCFLGGVPRRRILLERPAIVVARELTPTETAELPRHLLDALVTEEGSPTSHAAVLARGLGVPAVVGVPDLTKSVMEGADIAVDGTTGEVIIEPSDEDRRRLEGTRSRFARMRVSYSKLRDEPGQTSDGRRVEIAANIGSLDDLTAAREVGAEGSGLVRTEFIFLGREDPPSIDEQADLYGQILDAFPRHRVVIRTLDAGADKPLPFIERGRESNPALGVRGIRLGLELRHLLSDQLRAVARAADQTRSRPAVMFPMVSTVEEIDLALESLSSALREEGIEPEAVEIGAMIEVPAAALAVDRLVRRLSFLSIGTNDLLQYLYAADRLVPALASLPDLLDPSVLRFLLEVVSSAHQGGAWVGVCGEAAGSVHTALALVGLGVDELSMSAHSIPEIKLVLRRLDSEQIRSVAMQAIDAADRQAARALFHRLASSAGH